MRCTTTIAGIGDHILNLTWPLLEILDLVGKLFFIF